jgi:hypothetical protein
MQGTLPNLAALRDALAAHLPGLADEIALQVAAHAPVGHGETSGRLREDIHAESESTDDGAVVRVVSGVPEATFVIEGTAPHEIAPVNKQALFWEAAEHPVRRVQHPGTQPDLFAERAEEEVRQLIEDELSLIFQEVATQ